MTSAFRHVCNIGVGGIQSGHSDLRSTAQFAILVRSRLKGHGLGWLLMRRVIEHVGQLLAVVMVHTETRSLFFDRPRRREAARYRHYGSKSTDLDQNARARVGKI
jgi:GNAT superfamily N-acetyltransferase